MLDDLVICVLRDGLTTVEKTLFEQGRGDAVREMRAAFQDAVADRFTEVVEAHTGRRVVAFMSQAHVAPDLAIEVFFLDGAVEENGSHDTDGDERRRWTTGRRATSRATEARPPPDLPSRLRGV